MIKLTFDYNCLVNIHNQTGQYAALRILVDANNQGRCRIYVPAISASERTRDSRGPNYHRFRSLVESLGITNVEEVLPMAYLNMAFVGHCLIGGNELVAHERKIHEVLFPRIEFQHEDYRSKADDNAQDKGKWENAKCDVQALSSHINAGNDVFVTEDQNFLKQSKKQRLVDLGAKGICTPAEAVALL